MILRQKFGMELYELRLKSKGAGVLEDAASQAQTQTQAKTQRKKQTGKRLEAIEEDEEEEDAEEEGGGGTTQATKSEPRSPRFHAVWRAHEYSAGVQDVYTQINTTRGCQGSHGNSPAFTDV